VEGDLRFEIECDDRGVVTDARSSGTMFRGFEAFLKGKKPLDALGITPRICGICTSAHSYVCSNALRNLFNIDMPHNGYRVKNIVLGAENIQSHFVHFYFLFAPDLAHPRYKDKSLYAEVKERFGIGGSSYKLILNVRNDFMNLMGIFGGRWPHSLVMQPGGVSLIIDDQLRLAYAFDIYTTFKEKIEEHFLGCTLEDWLEIKSASKLQGYLDEQEEKSDLALFLSAAEEVGLEDIGKGPENYLDYGAYDLEDGTHLFEGGFYDGKFREFSHREITESVKYSFFEDHSGGHPFDEDSTPSYSEDGGKYSWIKAPRYQQTPVEMGPLARMVIDKDPLVLDLFKKMGASALLRVFARFQEGLRTLAALGEWMQALEINKPNINQWEKVEKGEGVGLGPAARGGLGHWIKVDKGVISNYQVITPTAVNASPKDDNDVHGPIESAVIGTAIEDKNDPIEVLHVVRSFDPCLVCSCHVLKSKGR
jgi:hydrogenase large subunit